jgi:hypothetical protein
MRGMATLLPARVNGGLVGEFVLDARKSLNLWRPRRDLNPVLPP